MRYRRRLPKYQYGTGYQLGADWNPNMNFGNQNTGFSGIAAAIPSPASPFLAAGAAIAGMVPAISGAVSAGKERKEAERMERLNAERINVGGRYGDFGTRGGNYDPTLSSPMYGRNGGHVLPKYQNGTPFQKYLSEPSLQGAGRNAKDTLIHNDPRRFDFDSPETWGQSISRSGDDQALAKAFTETYTDLSSLLPEGKQYREDKGYLRYLENARKTPQYNHDRTGAGTDAYARVKPKMQMGGLSFEKTRYYSVFRRKRNSIV